jgi:ribosomal protein S18 acetylase RimI-like enzyme
LLGPEGCDIVVVSKDEWDQYRSEIIQIENVFPSTLRDTESYLRSILDFDKPIFLVARIDGRPVGYLAGAALESFSEIPGVKQDPHCGMKDTIYLESHAVLEEFQSRGIGKFLMRNFVLRARQLDYQYIAAHVKQGFARARKQSMKA